jgi:chromosome segregation ATPase
VSAATVIGELTGVSALLMSTGVMYRGWRKRVESAATRPFLTGQAAVDEAELALRLKNERIADVERRRQETVDQLATATAQVAAQQAQITNLYTQLGQVQAENSDLRTQLAQAREREVQDRARIGALESDMAELRKHISLGT